MEYQWLRVCALSLLGALAGCTEPNPTYLSPNGDSTTNTNHPDTDGGSEVDGSVDPDMTFPDDTIPPPDLPSICERDEDCDDKRDCTEDKCERDACVNRVTKGSCLIDNTCYARNEVNPADSCQQCSPSDDEMGWTGKPDGQRCADEGLSCTEDVCQNGTCEHLVVGCLVGGVCYEEGDSPATDPCNECQPDDASGQMVFIPGKACEPSTGVAGMCFDGACRGWIEKDFSPITSGSVKSSSIEAVAKVPGSGIWAVGEYETNHVRGFIVQLGNAVSTMPVTTNGPMWDIHHQLAIGKDAYYLFNGASWSPSVQLKSEVSSTRFSVWGTTLTNGTEYYYLSGYEAGESAGVIECSSFYGFTFTCDDLSDGFAGSPLIGSVAGTISSSGTLGPVWAVAFGDWEDIYYLGANETEWTHEAPSGCYDASGFPCHNPADTQFMDLYTGSPSDAWVVGGGGMILRFDGVWHRVKGTPAQAKNTLTTVFSSPSDGLATVVGHRDTTAGREVVLFNYNSSLDRWFGPIVVRTFPTNGTFAQINDIDGEGYGNLWMVGKRPLPVSADKKGTGWFLRLQ